MSLIFAKSGNPSWTIKDNLFVEYVERVAYKLELPGESLPEAFSLRGSRTRRYQMISLEALYPTAPEVGIPLDSSVL